MIEVNKKLSQNVGKSQLISPCGAASPQVKRVISASFFFPENEDDEHARGVVFDQKSWNSNWTANEQSVGKTRRRERGMFPISWSESAEVVFWGDSEIPQTAEQMCGGREGLEPGRHFMHQTILQEG